MKNKSAIRRKEVLYQHAYKQDGKATVRLVKFIEEMIRERRGKSYVVRSITW